MTIHGVGGTKATIRKRDDGNVGLICFDTESVEVEVILTRNNALDLAHHIHEITRQRRPQRRYRRLSAV